MSNVAIILSSKVAKEDAKKHMYFLKKIDGGFTLQLRIKWPAKLTDFLTRLTLWLVTRKEKSITEHYSKIDGLERHVEFCAQSA